MQLLTLDIKQSTRLFWALAIGFAAVGILTANQDDAVIAGAAVLLGLVCLYPFYFWLLGAAPGLPIWPVFALITGTNTVLPMLQDDKALAVYSSERVVIGAVTTMMFIVVGTVAWLWLSARPQKIPGNVLMIARHRSEVFLLLFIVSGILYQSNAIAGWIEYPGNTMPVVRGLTNSLSSMGVFVLAFYIGRGLLNANLRIIFVALTGFYVVLCCTSLMLASAIVPVALATLGYMLGSARFPWKTVLTALVAISVLHAGKAEMRHTYWADATESTGGAEAGSRLTLTGIPEFFAEWITHGIEELGGIGGILGRKHEDATVSSAFERAGILHLLLLVQEKTPGQVPYFAGATYVAIPRLLVPRFIDDQKGFSHVGNVMLSVNYGLQTIEGTSSTSIYWGLVPEAYANFGYSGVAGLAVVLGAFYALISRLTVGVPMTSLRFVIGLLIMAGATKADTMSVFVTMQFQGVVAVSVTSLVLMRRQRNQFAAEAANEGRQASGSKSATDRRDYGNTGRNGLRPWMKNGETNRPKGQRIQRRSEDGMPAPGILEALIEGVPDGRADESLKDERLRAEETKSLRDEEPEGVGKWEGENVGRWERGQSGAETKSLRDEETEGVGRLEPETTAAADGLLVRALPIKTPKRVAAWMPRRVREQVVAQQRAAVEERRRK